MLNDNFELIQHISNEIKNLRDDLKEDLKVLKYDIMQQNVKHEQNDKDQFQELKEDVTALKKSKWYWTGVAGVSFIILEISFRVADYFLLR